jgi:DNA polymerase (family 10)
MNNTDIARTFDQVADLLEFKSENPFRIRAYRNAARTIQDLPEPVRDILDDPERTLTDLPGVGEDLAEKIKTIVKTGTLPMLSELLAEVPESVLALLRVSGLGPKRAATIHRELGVNTLDELREACQAQRVRALKGFGPKIEKLIAEGLEFASTTDKRFYWAHADQVVEALLAHLDLCPAVQNREVAGSYRRGKDTVGDLDVLAVADDAGAVMDHFGAFGDVEQVLLRGPTKMSVRLRAGIQVDLRIVPIESFGAALQYFTGSKEHNVHLRGMARRLGLKLSEYGVFRDAEQVAGRTEEDVYAAIGLPWIPPELRENRREFDWAAAGELPELIRLQDIRGDLHMHSAWSDGLEPIEQMAEAAKERGLKYIAITDHSKRVSMAGGLNAGALRRQWAEIDRLNKQRLGIRILKGVEVDILERGGLDLSDDVLAQADWVVASIHFGQNQSQAQITRRVVDALANPYVSAIAHPTGRLINQRKAYPIDLDAVLEAARKHGKFLELNAHPKRLDLDDVACAAAKERSVPIVISTDAHNINGLAAMMYGVVQARRGGLTKEDVANTRPWSEVKRMLGRRH